MKTIRIATGIKRVDLSRNVFSAIVKIRELLKEHRQVLIDRLLVDLPTYILYQYDARPTGDQLNNIKNRLHALRVGEISTFRYDSVIDDILDYDVVSVKSEPFYFEINEAISAEINPSQLQLVR
jgi:hypothetical protein